METILTLYSPQNDTRYVVFQDPDTGDTQWFAMDEMHGVLLEIPPPENPYEKAAQ